jgi:hypothetical protein
MVVATYNEKNDPQKLKTNARESLGDKEALVRRYNMIDPRTTNGRTINNNP